ncbi:M15 family metallopeptidase [Gloeothece citriformis]|uniref:M15 family metallopeptidase n=1 Tax=Gloeothece citriformis TaxID=2546356 RepID=UPI0002F6F5DA|nr:M15 family metallopeptidase [Gloeothece citriformis]
MKPYQKIPIEENGEPLVPIPLSLFAVESPHPYQKLGADYQGKSPYYIRQGVLQALKKAQTELQQQYPGWKIQIFDAYRPVAVQQFMVDYTFATVLQQKGLKETELSPQQQQDIWQQVYQIWAIPSHNPSTPPPHSTGAALDITLVNEKGNTIDMGGEIDELSDRSHPNYYAKSTIAQEQSYHHNRELLHTVMRGAGFRRHPGEWWHFSLGDQMWAWLYNQEQPKQTIIAYYGRV